MLNIAYINFRIFPLSGVDKKIEAQARAASQIENFNFNAFILNPTIEKSIDNISYIKFKRKNWPLSYLSFIYKINFQRYRFIESHLDLDKYDYIILRYPKADKSGIRFFREHHVITEHHTDELSELMLEFKNSANFLYKIIKQLRYQLEKKYSRPVLSNAKGIIAMTKQIENLEKQKAGTGIPSVHIRNGIDISAIQQTGYKPFDGKNIHMAFIASNFAPWHGLDRIVKAINSYSGHCIFHLHLIGKSLNINVNRPHKLVVYGSKFGHDLDIILSGMNLAIGALALYRKNIYESSSLKVREYIARGLPFIIAYDDVDLGNRQFRYQFYLQFRNNDGLIDMSRVVTFIKTINENHEQKELSDYMRQFALENLQWNQKMKQYLDFIHSIHTKSQI